MRRYGGLAAFALAFAFAFPAGAATITVTSTADSGPGTLHQAILDSNASVSVLDTIAFDIPGAGVQTIIVSTDLPTATDPVIVDGTTQPGYVDSPLIELTESTPTQGLRISAGGSTVRGLAIFEFGVQLTLTSNGGNVVEDCYIGFNAAATVTTTGLGLQIQNSPDTTIVGNVISGLTSTGIQLVASDRTIIRGNLIGTNPAGTAGLANGGGISVVNSDDVVVGGTVAGMGNLVSGTTTGNGIYVTGSANTLIAGNLIGTDITGTQPLPNNFGLEIDNIPTITIGGTAPAARNIISGNGTGIRLNSAAQGATIQNNYLGTDITGTLPLPNSLAILVNIQTATDILIGGPNPGEGNVIVSNQAGGNPAHGILSYGQRVTIRGNRIHDNQGLGFDIDPVGVNPNDAGDADGGANDGQNFPILTTVEILSAPLGSGTRIAGKDTQIVGIGTRIVGVLRSEASTQYTLDFYGNPGCIPRPQDFLEGQTYLGFGQVTTDGSGVGNFDITVSGEISPGDQVTATATDPEGNTSEFSQRLPFSVFPVSGPSTGGTAITIQGTDFASGATVTLGGQAATNVNVGSGTQITAQTPPLAAGTVNDLTVTNLDGTTGTLPKAFVSDFTDVPDGSVFHTYVTTLVRNAITAGVGGGLYGVNQATLRQQMAVFLLKAKYGVCYVPPPCVGIFSDVPCPSIFAAWIEDLADQGITGGCGSGVYCPQNPVRRDQMAVFLLKTKYGSSYVPPACDGDFTDVTCPSPFADWIEQLALEQITTGCGGTNYCPLNPNTRGQMAVFLTKTFNLQ
jgi:parallel beta-helix repeat protein